jgi:hypothetical protein
MRDVRGRTREITVALAAQAKSAAAGVVDIATVAREVASLQASTTEQVGILSTLAGKTGEHAIVQPGIDPAA